MPRWIRPNRDYLNRDYRYYYPAQEARVDLVVALFTSALAILAYLYIPINAIYPDCILLLYAALLSGYLMHRAICFYKHNEFSSRGDKHFKRLSGVESGSVVVAHIWHCAFRFVPFGAFSLARIVHIGDGWSCNFRPFHRCFSGNERESRGLQGKTFRELFLDLIPGSYYAVFAVICVALTQAALWLSMPVPLLALVAFILVFTFVEYRFRFVSPYRTDAAEQWGEEPYALLYMPEEELWMIRRRDETALRRKNAPCWVVITESLSKPCYPRLQLTGNLEYKQREVELRREKLLYIRRFDSVCEARSYAQNIHTDHLMNEKIRQLNPTLENLNIRSALALSCFNTMI